jgi:Na+/H+ antiporter NhaD/arsenite permease-like protein
MIEPAMPHVPDLTHTGLAIAALATFLFAYALVLSEELTEMRKSKPVVFASGVIWLLVALSWRQHDIEGVEALLRHNLSEFAGLFLFLLAAVTFVNTLQERGVFEVLRSWLVSRGYSLRTMFWITGTLAFVLSPVLDNLTTALVMSAVVLAIARDQRNFVVPTLINIVVAANAGGAFSPFGDVTTLMVWQAGIVPFLEFFALFLPSLVNWLVPATFLSMAIPSGFPVRSGKRETLKPHALSVIGLFAATVTGTVLLHQATHLPPFVGMMTGLGALAILGYFIRRGELEDVSHSPVSLDIPPHLKPATKPFDVFISMKRVEWETLLFFYGVILCIGGLSALGYLQLLATTSYGALGSAATNVLVGVASAIVDNIPIMFAVLSIDPEMSQGQWLLVTLTAGVGGSLLSIGSAAGAALMGQARGTYTFLTHLKWSWAIALGYAASIWTHLLVNAARF